MSINFTNLKGFLKPKGLRMTDIKCVWSREELTIRTGSHEQSSNCPQGLVTQLGLWIWVLMPIEGSYFLFLHKWEVSVWSQDLRTPIILEKGEYCYWTKLESTHPRKAKPICWLRVVVKESTMFLQDAQCGIK